MTRIILATIITTLIGVAYLIYLERICPNGEGIITSSGIACVTP